MKDSCSCQWLRVKRFVNCRKKMETSLTTVSFGQTAAGSMCWNCSTMNCSARHWTGCCCSASCLTDRCCCWSSVQPTSRTKRPELGYSKVAGPNSAAVPTLDSATCSAQQTEIAVGPGRSSESLPGMRCPEQARIQYPSRVPFRADRDSSSLIPPADVMVDECLLRTKCALRRPTDKDLVTAGPLGRSE